MYSLAKTADSSSSHVLSKVFDRLATHPFSYRFKDFIYAYRVENAQLKSTTEFLQPQFDERGNAYVEMFGELAMLWDQMNCIVIVGYVS